MPNKLRNIAKYVVYALRELDPRVSINIRWQMWRNRSNKDAIFIHIPKTAGTSLISVLQRSGAMWLKDEESIKKYFQNRGIVSFSHISLPSLVEAMYLSPEYLQRAWKFTFVRNPYDRAVSLYRYLISSIASALPPTTTFNIFCSYLEQNAYEPVGLSHVKGLSQLNPQVAWLLGADGTFLCDFVGRVENVEKDFEEVRQTLALTAADKKLPRENTTSRLPIETYYSDREMEIVARVYAEDFSRFGYDPARLPEK